MKNKDKTNQADVFNSNQVSGEQTTPTEKAVAIRKESNIQVGNLQLPTEIMDDYLSLMAQFTDGAVTQLPRVKYSKETSMYFFDWKPTDYIRNFDAIIMYFSIVRSYWDTEYKAGENKPPRCASSDDKIPDRFEGEKPVNVNCKTCPLSKFTKDKDGKKVSPKCRQRLNLFLLLPGKIQPVLLSMPASNIKIYGRYADSLLLDKAEIPPLVKTRFGLEGTTINNFPTSVITLESLGRLEHIVTQDDLVAEIKSTQKMQKEYMEVMTGQSIEFEETAEVVSVETVESEDPAPFEEPF